MWTSTRVALVTHRDGERPNLRDIPVLLERARREADGAETDVRLVRVDVIRDEVGELRFRHRGGVATCRSAFLGGHLAPENERVRCGPTFLLGYPIHRGDQLIWVGDLRPGLDLLVAPLELTKWVGVVGGHRLVHVIG